MAFAFIVEDGTGVADANAYADLAFVRDYHEGRGQLADWDGTAITTAITGADATANTIAAVAHPFESGDGPVRFTGADLPAGLELVTDYWLVVSSSSALKVAASLADAIAEVPTTIDLADVGSGSMAIVHPDFGAQREAIVQATDFVEGRYGDGRFVGIKGSLEQGLHFPATGVFDQASRTFLGDQVPDKLKRGIAELALVARSASLTDTTSSGGAVISESKTSGPISKSVTYATAIDPTRRTYPAADRWLRSVLRPATAERA